MLFAPPYTWDIHISVKHRVTRYVRVNRTYIDLLCLVNGDLLEILQEHAFESSQKYKEGKFIIELAHMIKENGWE